MIKILCVGKMKEKGMLQLQQEYLKRLSRFHKIELVELKEGNPSFEESKLIDDESSRLLEQLKPTDYVVIFDVKSQLIDSIELSQLVDQSLTKGNIVFVLGGSLGFNETILNRANHKISMSKMTFPHLLARIMVLEQLYRSFKILYNQSYHK